MSARHLAASLTLTMILASSAQAQLGTPSQPTGPVERRYYADGSFPVARTTSTDACDRKGNVCDVWYPSTIASAGTLPVILWANGTSSKPVPPEVYNYYLSHLASWGFIVVATRDGKTGYGDTVLDSLDWLTRQAADAGSRFHGHVDVDRVGVGGHSQGATGAANAMLKSGGRVKTAVVYELPAQLYCNPADLCLLTPDLAAATAGSIFYVSGTADAVATDTQVTSNGQLNSQTAYYNATPAPLLKAKGLVRDANHTDLLGRPDCNAVDLNYRLTCNLGVYGYLGFPTAWFAWQLKGDGAARAAFSRNGGEFFGAKAWSGQTSNVP